MTAYEGEIVPDKRCSRCGGPLHAFTMDVGHVEFLCLECDNRRTEE